MSLSSEYLGLLYEAVNSPFGICVETNDAEALRHRLYALRREYEGFSHLAFLISPLNGTDLWIVKKEQANGEE